MLTFEQIKELIELVASRRLHGLEIERSGFALRITGEHGGAAVAAPVSDGGRAPVAEAVVSAPAPTAEPALPSPPAADVHVVNSPIVGTFYAAPSPDAPPFVKLGDRVRKGQVLCIVEAMKLMNEIECDADGVVAEIYPKNGQPVEFGEPLFGLRAD